jgi:hypothetical protein
MTTIKGPITLKGTAGLKELIAKNMGNVKLPFTATGFTCTNKPDGVDYTGVEFKGDVPQTIAPKPEPAVVEQPKPEPETPTKKKRGK